MRGPVTSPTFVIARVHPSTVNGPALVHVDAYRLGGALELDDLDLDAVGRRERHRGRVGPRAGRGPQRATGSRSCSTSTPPPRSAPRRSPASVVAGAARPRMPALATPGRCAVLTLAIDTSTSAIGVAVLARRRRPRRRRRRSTPGRTPRCSRPLVRDTLAAAGARPADLTDVAVGTGPGPFTGLRVGLVTALDAGPRARHPGARRVQPRRAREQALAAAGRRRRRGARRHRRAAQGGLLGALRPGPDGAVALDRAVPSTARRTSPMPRARCRPSGAGPGALPRPASRTASAARSTSTPGGLAQVAAAPARAPAEPMPARAALPAPARRR